MATTSRMMMAVAIVAGSLLAMACNDGTAPGSTRLSVKLTDAPGDVQAAVVTIAQVYLQRADSDSVASRLVLSDSARTVDLLTLVGTTTDLVKGKTIPGGAYRQLRFVITGGYLAIANSAGGTDVYATSSTYAALPGGTVVRGVLQMPSYATSGLKVSLPDTALVFGDSAATLTVDFDVARSFGAAAGQSGRWVMSPVVTALRK